MACGRSLLACRPRLEYRHPSLRADQISDGKIQGDARMVSPDREPSEFSANGARLRSAVQKVDGSAEERDCIVKSFAASVCARCRSAKERRTGPVTARGTKTSLLPAKGWVSTSRKQALKLRSFTAVDGAAPPCLSSLDF